MFWIVDKSSAWRTVSGRSEVARWDLRRKIGSAQKKNFSREIQLSACRCRLSQRILPKKNDQVQRRSEWNDSLRASEKGDYRSRHGSISTGPNRRSRLAL